MCHCQLLYQHSLEKGGIKKQTPDYRVKVKVTLVQALRLCTGRTAHMGSRGIALPFHDHDTRRVSVAPRPLFTPGKDPVPIVQDDGLAPGPVWTGAENLAPPPPGFDPRTVQPVASRYTNYTTRPTDYRVSRLKFGHNIQGVVDCQCTVPAFSGQTE